MRDKIIEMLGKGIPATQVASAVGCDDSYISQLMAEEGVEARVIELKAAHFSQYVEQDQKLDDAEAQALEKVAQLVPFITRPAEAVRVYGVLNAAKRRTVDTANAAGVVAQTVHLELPEAARVRFTITSDKQVIEIEGRSMTTMPAKSLAAQLEQRNAARLLSHQIPTRLPIEDAVVKLTTKKDPSLATSL
jgi:hypothetical protein